MTTYVACTIVARNYVAQARVVFESFRKFHPNVPFLTLLADGVEEDRQIEGIGEVVLTSDLGLEPATLDVMATIYDVMEYSTAMKPAILMHCLRRGAPAAIYFDPDIQIFDDLTDQFELAEREGVILTPHSLNPMPHDGKDMSERSVMLAGIYNLGFVGVGASGYRFVLWWLDRLRNDGISDPANALFADQRWIDWVPALFPHHIVRDRGMNVAHWNLHDRRIAEVNGEWFAGGSPLRFLHFSGYDFRTPWLLSKHTKANPRVLLSDQPDLQRLADSYRGDLLRHGIEEWSTESYGHGRLPNGLVLALPIRRLVRAVREGEVALVPEPPLAFARPDDFVEWLLTPTYGDPRALLTPLELSLWLARSDLQGAFPGVDAIAGGTYKSWFAADPQASELLATVREIAGPRAPRADAPVDSLAALLPVADPLSWLVITATVPGTEVHEIAERIVDTFLATGATAVVADATLEFGSQRIALYGQVLLVVDAVRPPPSDIAVALASVSSRRVVVPLGSDAELKASGWNQIGADEVWGVVGPVTSPAQATPRHSRAIGYPVSGSEAGPILSRAALGLPHDKRVVLLDIERNESVDDSGVLRLIDAFSVSGSLSAGSRAGDVLLVLPIGDFPIADQELVYASAADCPDVLLIREPLTVGRKRSLVGHATLIVSLHAQPVLGLGSVLAVEHGIPVVCEATAPGISSPSEGTTLAHTLGSLLDDASALSELAGRTRDIIGQSRSPIEMVALIGDLVTHPDGEQE